MAKKQEIQIPVNTALQANITPIGIEFSRNNILLGENYCRIYGIINYPSEAEYGWCAKLTNIPGTIVSINYEPTDNGTLMAVMNKNININRGLAASAKDSLERQRRNKAADNMEYAIEQMDQYNEKMGEFNMTIMVLSRSEEDFLQRCTRVESICNSMNCRIRILSNVQKEGYQQIAPTYAQNKTISEMTRRVLPIRAFVGGFPFAASGFNDGSGYYLRNFEKRARKYNGSIVVATQSIVDFLDPSVKMYGQQVLDLPSIKFIFGADGQSLEETRNVFSLNEAQYDLVASKQRGLALMKIGSQAVKVRFALSDERLELFGKGGGL